MRGAYIVGADAEIITLAENQGWTLHGVVDKANIGSEYFGYSVVGDDEWMMSASIPPEKRRVIITLDDPIVKKRLFQKYSEVGFDVCSVVGGTVREKTRIEEGCIVQGLSHVSVSCDLSRGVKINVGANVMHDNKIGDFSTVAPNAVLLGYVEVGREVFVGANATILPRVRIGNKAVVGAGAVVTDDVSAGETVKGVPARA